jgi:hypothetical protein
MDAVKRKKILLEKVEILDESTGQIILEEHATVVYSSNIDSDCDQVLFKISITNLCIYVLREIKFSIDLIKY